MFPAAVGALHAADLAAQGLQGVQDPGVYGQYGGRVAVGQSLVLTKLRRRGRAGVVIMGASEEIVDGGRGPSWRSRGTCRARLSWGSLWIGNYEVFCPYVDFSKCISADSGMSPCSFWPRQTLTG